MVERNGSFVHRRSIRLVAALAIVAALAACVAWWYRTKPVNVLVITLDTTRVDRFGCYGYRAGKTPVLDSLAADGVVCDNAYTVAPMTLPAHVSLFTGLYP